MRIRSSIAVIEAMYRHAKKNANIVVGVATIAGTVLAFVNGGKKAQKAVVVLQNKVDGYQTEIQKSLECVKQMQIFQEKTNQRLLEIGAQMKSEAKSEDEKLKTLEAKNMTLEMKNLTLEKKLEHSKMETIATKLLILPHVTNTEERAQIVSDIVKSFREDDSATIVDSKNFPEIAECRRVHGSKMSITKDEKDAFIKHVDANYGETGLTLIFTEALDNLMAYLETRKEQIDEETQTE